MTIGAHVFRRASTAALLITFAGAMFPAWAGWDYAKLDHQLREGDKPRVVIDFAKCLEPSGAGGPPVVAVPTFSSYNLTPKFIATSQTHAFEGANGAMLLEYVRLRVFDAARRPVSALPLQEREARITRRSAHPAPAAASASS